ncbi:amidohydrolase family protein [Acidimicrobiia bacterium EGI L10123]|uniref:N-acyl-D-amino-acid deacylase family protein n=1 Tax=Salinilacustrithrix flava TaxID=2957203 RepID=UPI003D7C1E2E|nr:amidohydrolase family protein [Acidimicrobiia bacterium EGI L10123]
MAEHDLVIRGGTVVDGTGAPRRTADVAISDGTVTEVGSVSGRGAREIDADGALVTPGFVDVHCHYDGQATWDERLQPSSWHGVTTVVMGNCGVGFAPVHDQDHERLIQLMEGVEDIPGAALAEGLQWGWTDFAGFLDAVDRRPHDLDVAAQVPHAAVRLHAMGERGADHEEAATPEEIAEMGRIVADAIQAGALGFTTSRTRNHKTSTGAYTPTLTAARDELVGIAEAVGATGTGVLQMVGDFLDLDHEFGTLVEMMRASGRPLSFSLAQSPLAPDQFRELLKRLDAAVDDGFDMRAQVAPRAVGLLLGLDCTLNPFLANPVWREVADRPLAEQVATMSDPEFRRRVLEAHETGKAKGKLGGGLIGAFDRMFPLDDPPEYEPDLADAITGQAQRAGVDPAEWAYDFMLGDGGSAMFYVPFLNYAEGNLDTTREMLAHPRTVPGLSDGGAHVGTICDGSFPTFLLTHWGRDRQRGDLFDIEWLVRQHTLETARTVGLLDRGVLAPGMRADLNVIDFDRLAVSRPEMHHDLPAGGRRVLQRATGYRHTVVAGVETYADGEATGELPGRLVRGAQPAPG